MNLLTVQNYCPSVGLLWLVNCKDLQPGKAYDNRKNKMDEVGSTPNFMDLGNEDRLREVVELGLLTPETDAILDAVVTEAATRLGLPISLVSIVLDESQFFAASHGLKGWLETTRGTPVEMSFCSNAVLSGEPFVVEDALTHPVTMENPLVTEDGIRCYAGIPLISSRGFRLGTLCVLGNEPHEFQESDLVVLRELAADAVNRIESRRTTT